MYRLKSFSSVSGMWVAEGSRDEVEPSLHETQRCHLTPTLKRSKPRRPGRSGNRGAQIVHDIAVTDLDVMMIESPRAFH